MPDSTGRTVWAGRRHGTMTLQVWDPEEGGRWWCLRTYSDDEAPLASLDAKVLRRVIGHAAMEMTR